MNQALLRAEAKYAETIRAREKEKVMLHEQIEKVQSDLDSSGKQVRYTLQNLRELFCNVTVPCNNIWVRIEILWSSKCSDDFPLRNSSF